VTDHSPRRTREDTHARAGTSVPVVACRSNARRSLPRGDRGRARRARSFDRASRRVARASEAFPFTFCYFSIIDRAARASSRRRRRLRLPRPRRVAPRAIRRFSPAVVVHRLDSNDNRMGPCISTPKQAAPSEVADSGAFYTLVPIRPRPRGERHSLRTLPGVSLRPPLAFNPRPRRLSTPPDAFELHPDIARMERPSVVIRQLPGAYPELAKRWSIQNDFSTWPGITWDENGVAGNVLKVRIRSIPRGVVPTLMTPD